MSLRNQEELIFTTLSEHNEGLTIEDVSRLLNISRTTAARYLESLYHAGRAERRPLGPAKIYRVSSRIQSGEILTLLTEGVLILDSGGRIREVNPAFGNICRTSDTVLSGEILSYTSLSSKLPEELLQILCCPPDKPLDGEFQLFSDGDIRQIQYKVVPLTFSDSSHGVACIISDVTEISGCHVKSHNLEEEFKSELSRIYLDYSQDLKKAKSTVRELSGRERAIRYMLQNVQAIIMKVNNSGKIVFCNHYASENAGLIDGEQEPRISLYTLFPQRNEQDEGIHEKINQVIQGVINYTHWESPIIISDNVSAQVFSWNLIAIKKNEKNRIIILAGIEITDLILRERQISRSHQQLRVILDHLPDPSFAIDKKREVIMWNHQMEVMTGLLSSTTLGRCIDEFKPSIYGYNRPVLADLIFNRHDPTIYGFFEKLEQEVESLTAETVAYRQDGSRCVYWVKASPWYDETGVIAGAIQSLRDITFLREGEAKIRDEEKLFRGIAENALDNIVVINRDGIILYVNQSMGRLVNADPETMIGSHIRAVPKIRQIIPDCDRFKPAFLSGVPIHELFPCVYEGVDLLMDTSYIPQKDQNGLISSVLIVLRNISSLRDEIARMQINREKVS